MAKEPIKKQARKVVGVCPGCGRKELHKMCPAHGTPYYMSGVLFTKEMEEKWTKLRPIVDKSISYIESNYDLDLEHGRSRIVNALIEQLIQNGV